MLLSSIRYVIDLKKASSYVSAFIPVRDNVFKNVLYVYYTCVPYNDIPIYCLCIYNNVKMNL